jgi:hypothetical protein
MRILHLSALLASLALPLSIRAQADTDSLLPAGAANCRATVPPDAAGIAVTPGGFVLVFPRNDVLSDQYSGCKLLWIVDAERAPRLATLYFEKGQLARAIAHDTRDASGAVVGACAYPAGRSLLLNAGGRFDDSACRGVAGESFYALRVATWPRRCMTTPDAPVCKADPK